MQFLALELLGQRLLLALSLALKHLWILALDSDASIDDDDDILGQLEDVDSDANNIGDEIVGVEGADDAAEEEDDNWTPKTSDQVLLNRLAQLEARQKPKPSNLVTIVSSCNQRSRTGVLENSLEFSMELAWPESYRPFVGDWVTAELDWTEEQAKVTRVQPLRMMRFSGRVTSMAASHGYANGEVYFHAGAVQPRAQRLRRGDPVHGVAIESVQSRTCNYRAVVVHLGEEDQAQTGNTWSQMWDLGTMVPHESHLLTVSAGSSLTDPHAAGVQFQPPICNFSRASLGSDLERKVSITNAGDEPIVWLGARVDSTTNDQFCVVKEEGDARLTVSPGDSVEMLIRCLCRLPGTDTQLCIVEFAEFSVGLSLTVTVADPLCDSGPLQSAASSATTPRPYASFGRGARRHVAGFDSQIYDTGDVDSARVLPGVRPARGPETIRLPHRLGQHQPPPSMARLILGAGDGDGDGDDNKDDDEAEIERRLLAGWPSLAEPLSPGRCYAAKLSALLHLEELAEALSLRQYSLDLAMLEPAGPGRQYLALEVPGLAEGRPSLLFGDKVRARPNASLQQLEALNSRPADPGYEGYVHELRCSQALLKFHPHLHSALAQTLLSQSPCTFSVQFCVNRTGYRRCHHAVSLAGSSSSLPWPTLFPELDSADVKPPQACCRSLEFFNSRLNERQRCAVRRVLAGRRRPRPYVVFGPPGTGKTVTLVECALQLLNRLPDSRLLVCAPSNSAADQLADRLLASGRVSAGQLVRLNAARRKDVESVTTPAVAAASVGPDRLGRAAMHRVLVATCVTTGWLHGLRLRRGHFTHALIDEAGQATEPELLLPISLASEQVVLAGDPMQLGPVVQSPWAQKFGLGESLLHRLLESSPAYARCPGRYPDDGYDPLLVTKLLQNYRSHPGLLQVYSSLFYHSELIPCVDPASGNRFLTWPSLPNPHLPLLFHGVIGEDRREGDSPSWFNPAETVLVTRYVIDLLAHWPGLADVEDGIGVVTPYRKQAEKIRAMLLATDSPDVRVASVEEFQGQERQAIVLSTVRSQPDLLAFDRQHRLGFLASPRRFNVSVSRAAGLLVVVGNPHLLAADPCWLALIRYALDNGCYVGCHFKPPPVEA
uniref:RNA helicase n=1 Tax=Macrostomum lignano TaxID=282301 RepID=A0A0M3RSS3_9PLAT|nr:Moloney leukemia virus 10-like 1-like protein [Macrostomum lignano]